MPARRGGKAVIASARCGIGFVFQYHLITAFTALEKVMLPMLGAAGFADDAMRDGLPSRSRPSAWRPGRTTGPAT